MNDHRYHPALDGLRAVAVICVVLFHAGATSGLADLAPGGFIGVSVFFTLSGYLVMTVLLREIADSGGLDVSRFWARRIRRLAPASLTVVVGAVVLAPLFWTGFRWVDAAAGIFGYTNWHVIVSGEGQLLRTIVGPLGPFWSLAVEEQFYVLLTIAVLVAVHTKQPVRTLSFMVIAGWIGSLLVQLLLSGPQLRVEFGTDARGTELLAGCGLALVLHVRPEALRQSTVWLVPAGIVGFVAILALASTTDYDPPWLLRGGYAAVSVVSTVLVASLLLPGPLTWLLAQAPFVAVGRMSYSLYVVHWPIILIMTSDRIGIDGWPLLVVKVVASLVAATVLHLTIEQPMRAKRTSIVQ
jgi:peptidoglycan/LPS O-acetylase OafA/YrhL